MDAVGSELILVAGEIDLRGLLAAGLPAKLKIRQHVLDARAGTPHRTAS